MYHIETSQSICSADQMSGFNLVHVLTEILEQPVAFYCNVNQSLMSYLI